MLNKYTKSLTILLITLAFFTLSVFVVSADYNNNNNQNNNNYNNGHKGNPDCAPTPTPTPKVTPTCFPTPTPKNGNCDDNDWRSHHKDQCPTSTPTPMPSVTITPTPICEDGCVSPSVSPTPTQTPSNNNSNGGGSSPTFAGSSTNPPSCGNSKPNQPYNVLAVAGPGAGQVTLSWGPPSGSVSDYSITYSDDPNTQKWGVASTGNVTTYTISGLGVNKYYFWVNAVNGCMPGDQVGPVSVGGTGGPEVLGLSYTSGDQNYLLVFAQLFGALLMASTGLMFFKKNAQ